MGHLSRACCSFPHWVQVFIFADGFGFVLLSRPFNHQFFGSGGSVTSDFFKTGRVYRRSFEFFVLFANRLTLVDLCLRFLECEFRIEL